MSEHLPRRTKIVATVGPASWAPETLRALAASAQLVTLDKQGRVTVDEQLRIYAGLTPDSPVTVAGAFDRLEIWSPERYAQVTDEGTASMGGATGSGRTNERE